MPQRKVIAWTLLHMFKSQQARVGYTICFEVAAAFAQKKGWSEPELLVGIEYGGHKGWFENDKFKFLRLTEIGKAEMDNM